MPLHRNKSLSQKTHFLKLETVFVKENYMLSREEVTWFTQLYSDPKVTLLPEFVFKGKGSRTHQVPQEGANYPWAPKGLYLTEQMLGIIKKLPNRFYMFTEKGFAIYALDDYAVHLMSEIRQALFKKGYIIVIIGRGITIYILVIIGGVITGDIQINDTHCYRRLKRQYTDLEIKLMLE